MNKPHIAVIGGGCAGLSAAATLVDRGYQVTLFESSAQLGGRARTVPLANNSLMHLLDNGQHILLGAYRETLALLDKIGVDEKQVFLRHPLQIKLQSTSGKTVFSLKSIPCLPAPFDVLMGLLSCKGLSFSERISAIKLMARIRRGKISQDKSLEGFLLEHKQSAKLNQMLWEPLCLAALNTPIAIASTVTFFNVLNDSFSSTRFSQQNKTSDFLLPKLDLSQIIAQPLARYIQSKGGVIKRNRRIRSLVMDGNGFNLETRDGQSFFSHIIIAVAPTNLGQLIDKIPKLNNALLATKSYLYQPIYTIYLQYPAETKMPSAMIGLSDSLGQWLFDRGQLCNQHGLMAVIISAAGRHQLLSHDALALKLTEEIKQAFPDMPKPLWHQVIAEKRATFSCMPNLPRPHNKTLQENLYLAGDYTYADYPATIEGAVRSGIACANLIVGHSD
ncbi:MAG: FAD-binding protein [Methylotenera sp.]|nr:FAD-binding protein [Methylotenera sp.]MSP99888.1 FAD-binding protein [Methylotenera sp.]